MFGFSFSVSFLASFQRGSLADNKSAVFGDNKTVVLGIDIKRRNFVSMFELQFHVENSSLFSNFIIPPINDPNHIFEYVHTRSPF